MSNISLTERITLLYITSHSTPLTPWQGKSPHELYLSDNEETLIAILLVKSPSPRRGYLSAKEETLITILLINTPLPHQGNYPREQYRVASG